MKSYVQVQRIQHMHKPFRQEKNLWFKMCTPINQKEKNKKFKTVMKVLHGNGCRKDCPFGRELKIQSGNFL